MLRLGQSRHCLAHLPHSLLGAAHLIQLRVGGDRVEDGRVVLGLGARLAHRLVQLALSRVLRHRLVREGSSLQPCGLLRGCCDLGAGRQTGGSGSSRQTAQICRWAFGCSPPSPLALRCHGAALLLLQPDCVPVTHGCHEGRLLLLLKRRCLPVVIRYLASSLPRAGAGLLRLRDLARLLHDAARLCGGGGGLAGGFTALPLHVLELGLIASGLGQRTARLASSRVGCIPSSPQKDLHRLGVLLVDVRRAALAPLVLLG